MARAESFDFHGTKGYRLGRKNLGKLLYSADRDLNSSYRCASYLEPRFLMAFGASEILSNIAYGI